MISYGPSGKYIQSVTVEFHRDSLLFNRQYKEIDYLIDPVGLKVYVLERKESRWTLYPLDHRSGSLKPPVKLPDYPGMTAIQVYADAVYFLYPEKKYPFYIRLFRFQL